MKVLIALDSLNRGGAETRVLDVCRNAGRFGIEAVVTAFSGGHLENDFQNGDFEFIKMKRRLPVDPALVLRLRKLLKDRKIDIAHGFQPVEALHLFLAAVGTDVKCVQTHEGFLKGWKNIRAGRFISRKVNANLAVSKAQTPWLRNELKVDTDRNFFVLHNAVDEDRLKPSGKDFRAELSLDKSVFLCGMVANFLPTPTKDQLTVCKALKELFRKQKNTRFVFVGNVSPGGEEYYERCRGYCEENGIAERVFFTGGRTDVPDILAALDLFVLSSLSEGLPVAVIEAMLMRVPLVLSNIPPLLEVADDGRCAVMFKPGDHKELSDKIAALLQDRKKMEMLGKSADRFARQHYTMESHFKELNRIYSGLVG